jgi:hypothetical protein
MYDNEYENAYNQHYNYLAPPDPLFLLGIGVAIGGTAIGVGLIGGAAILLLASAKPQNISTNYSLNSSGQVTSQQTTIT